MMKASARLSIACQPSVTAEPQAEMNTYAFASAANDGVRLHGASMSRRAIAQACPRSSRPRRPLPAGGSEIAISSQHHGYCSSDMT